MSATLPAIRVHRIEVSPAPGQQDPRARRVEHDARAIGFALAGCSTARVYLIQGPLDEEDLDRVRQALLTDPVSERSLVGSDSAAPETTVVEVHPLPGVMDPAAQSVREAVFALVGVRVEVSTGWRYDLRGLGMQEAERLARRVLANPVVHGIHTRPFLPERLPQGAPAEFRPRSVPILELDNEGLNRLSREGHLFLSDEEMRSIQAEFARRGRDPTDIELETLAQTWSEHCVHKTLKSRVTYRGEGEDVIRWQGRPGHTVKPDGSITIENLLKSTVAAATHELIAEGVDWTLSVFKDNAGIIAFDDETAVCIKVETHNHPSALEPYGGAATGVGGCIRDVIGTGLGARPIANTNVFCVALPESADVPGGCIAPARVLREVTAGVRDYGNRMGIPTVNGAVFFDDRYVGNPLVYCGCIGVMPRSLTHGAAEAGDLIVAVGGRTGRDGIHGATFSSAELTDSHADEFAHAVQIGNAIEEKRVLDAILRARDETGSPLYRAITDCGAGGFSSAVGEMGHAVGAEVNLEQAPLKYDGLTYTEIWISEAQERMVLAVPSENLDAMHRICSEEGVEMAVLGRFGTPERELVLRYAGHEVGRLSMDFLHEGIPTPVREAVWKAPRITVPTPVTMPRASIGDMVLSLLAHPNISSKHWLVRQYDHEVQGNTVIKPLVGPEGRGPGDGAVIEPVPGSGRGLAVACGLATWFGDPSIGGDSYLMALASIDECVRNLVCVGADPARVAILDNFCWPSCRKPENLGSLVRAAEGCYDGAKAYRTPFVSGKDSLNNQFTTEDGRTIEIPPTLLITGIGIVPDVTGCPTSDAKTPGNILVLVGKTEVALGGSHLQRAIGLTAEADRSIPRVDLNAGPVAARAVHACMQAGLVVAAHDVSDGGVLIAVAEMLIGGSAPKARIGAKIELAAVHADPFVAAFAETPGRYLLEISEGDLESVRERLQGVPLAVIGRLDASGRLRAADVDLDVEALAQTWRRPLDW
ncbi:MAG: phosphoribosylformylglycinamidine synthase subunit PurL [Phycisphaeraceae bacterium]|nr:phosphoribosylformylglycinamidine synthase subunit PurL [Phycisphaeraceae bacterium]MCW5753841.1 phosphoribosylformylglycinamidine synthase subunit PurL [Phycisphaeraceae bacterium]